MSAPLAPLGKEYVIVTGDSHKQWKNANVVFGVDEERKVLFLFDVITSTTPFSSISIPELTIHLHENTIYFEEDKKGSTTLQFINEAKAQTNFYKLFPLTNESITHISLGAFSNPTVLTNKSGVIIQMNDSALLLCNCTLENMIGRSVLALFGANSEVERVAQIERFWKATQPEVIKKVVELNLKSSEGFLIEVNGFVGPMLENMNGNMELHRLAITFELRSDTKKGSVKEIKTLSNLSGKLRANLTNIMEKYKEIREDYVPEEINQHEKELEDMQTEASTKLCSTSLLELGTVDMEEMNSLSICYRDITMYRTSFQRRFVEILAAQSFGSENSVVQDQNALIEKMRTGGANAIEEIIRYLFQQVELTKQQLFLERKKTAELEHSLEFEINDLQELLLCESEGRKKLRVKLEQTSQVHSSLISEISLLRKSLELLSHEHYPNECLEEYNASVNAIIESVSFKLTTSSNLCDFSNPTTLARTSNFDMEQLLCALATQVEKEMETRMLYEDQTFALQAKVDHLRHQIQQETQHLPQDIVRK